MVITFQFLQIHSPWCNLVLLMCTNEYGLFTVLSQWVLFVTSGVDGCFAGGWLVVPYANQRCWYTLYNWCICVRGCVCGGIGGMHHSIFHQHNHHQHLLIRLPHIMLLGEHDVSNEFTVSDSGQIFRVIRYLVMLLLFSFSSDLLSVFFFCIANSLWINHDPFSFIIYAIPQTEKLYPLRWWRHQQQWINEDGGGIIMGVKTIARKWWRKEKKNEERTNWQAAQNEFVQKYSPVCQPPPDISKSYPHIHLLLCTILPENAHIFGSSKERCFSMGSSIDGYLVGKKNATHWFASIACIR